MAKKRPEFYVYVVELRREASAKPSKMGVVYVGETGLLPEQRLEKHLAGQKASRHVRRFGVKLRPDLAPKSAFLTKSNALKAELRTAERLRRQGYIVLGGQGLPFMAGAKRAIAIDVNVKAE